MENDRLPQAFSALPRPYWLRWAGPWPKIVPDQFVVTGAAVQRIKEFNQINGETARRLTETCEAFARDHGHSVSIYILDQFGNRVHMHRIDGRGWNNIYTAEMKARTALRTR